MKKSKLSVTSLFLAMALFFVNINPVRVYANDPSNGGPQGTSQKKAQTPQIPPEVFIIISMLLRHI